MRALLLLLLLGPLALPGALAVGACTVAGTCAHAWSAAEGTCGGAGSERNVVDVDVAPVLFGGASLFLESFCVRSGATRYGELRADAAAFGEHAYVAWYNNGGECTIIVFTDGAVVGDSLRRHTCHGALAPMLPALLP